MISLVQGSRRLVYRILKPYNTLILTLYLSVTLQNIKYYPLSFTCKIIMTHPPTRMLDDETRRGGVINNDRLPLAIYNPSYSKPTPSGFVNFKKFATYE